jgi:hypothetical protein
LLRLSVQRVWGQRESTSPSATSSLMVSITRLNETFSLSAIALFV